MQVLLFIFRFLRLVHYRGNTSNRKMDSQASGDFRSSESRNEGHASFSSSEMIGLLLLFISLCFDGGTGAYEDKLMAVHAVGPFDLMYNIQLGKTIIAGVGLIILNQIHLFFEMCHKMGFVLVALGLTGAFGQVFIFVTIAKFGALTCSIIGLARKITTLLASIFVYGHKLTWVQVLGLILSIGSMFMEFSGKKGARAEGSLDGHQTSDTRRKIDEEVMAMNRLDGVSKEDLALKSSQLEDLKTRIHGGYRHDLELASLAMPSTETQASTETTSGLIHSGNNKTIVVTAGFS